MTTTTTSTIARRINSLALTYALDADALITGLLYAGAVKKAAAEHTAAATPRPQPARPTPPRPEAHPAPARVPEASGLAPTQALAAACVADLLK